MIPGRDLVQKMEKEMYMKMPKVRLKAIKRQPKV